MVERREVVITGVGVVSPIGIGSQAFWDALIEQRSGVRSIEALQQTEAPIKFGGEVVDFDAKKYVTPRKSLKVMCHEIQMAFAAAVLGMQEAQLSIESLDSDRLGVVLGSEMFYGELLELADAYRSCIASGDFQYELWGERAMGQLYPLWMLKYLPNMAACHIGIALDARGHNNTIVQGEVSSLLALIESVTVIQRGMADVMLTGGTGSRVNLTQMLYRGDQDQSHRCDAPEAASRPFDALRDGTVNGEGAAMLVLESREHAEQRGANILATVRGYSSTYAPSIAGVAPAAEGILRSIDAALRSAQLTADEIGHINAHGASTIEGDQQEAIAVRAKFKDRPVTAPKSFFGNLGAGSGAIELAVSILGLGQNRVPVTLNYERPDPRCPVHVIHGEAAEDLAPAFLKLNQARTGQAAAVVLSR